MLLSFVGMALICLVLFITIYVIARATLGE